MKKWILSAACILAFSTYAAAQSNTSKPTQAKAVKKGTDNKKSTSTKSNVVVQTDTSTHNAKIILPAFPVDTSHVPAAKKEQ